MTDDDKSTKAVLLGWKTVSTTLIPVINHRDSGQGPVGHSLYASSLDVAESGLVGSELKTAAGLVRSITSRSQPGGEVDQKILAAVEALRRDVAQLRAEVVQRLNQIEARLDQIRDLVKWTFAFGATNPYAIFLTEAIKRWEAKKESEPTDGKPTASQIDLARQFAAADAGALENQLALYYHGLLGLDFSDQSHGLGVLDMYLKDSWQAAAQQDFGNWYRNVSGFISNVKSLLIRSMHAMMWAVSVTDPTQVERYRTQYAGWLETFDTHVLTLPAVLHSLLVKGQAHTFKISLIGGNPVYESRPLLLTKPYQDGWYEGRQIVSQLFVFPYLNASGQLSGDWCQPPLEGTTQFVPYLCTGLLDHEDERNRVTIEWEQRPLHL